MEILGLLKKITPEIIEIVEKRYLILRAISYNQPIGRRALSSELGFKERTVRDEISILKNEGLLNIDLVGMNITEEGEKILHNLQSIYGELKGIPDLEERLARKLNINNLVIVHGNSNENGMILRDMGKITSKILKSKLRDDFIVGVTGGSTMAVVAEETTLEKNLKNITVIPVRGGLGPNVETQSNSIAATLGNKLGGKYRLLYVPDVLEEEALNIILKNKEIKEAIELIENMNILMFGIGRADTMAKRRNLSEDKIDELIKDGAVSEALGHYFDIHGNEIWEFKTIGLSLDRFKTLESVIGVAGGDDKAEAIISVAMLNKNMTLIIDEAAAKRIDEIVEDATL